MIYFISRDDFFYPIGRIRAMQVRLFSYFLEKDDTQEYPDDDANQNQKPIHEACARFRFFMQVLGYIVLEEQIDGGYGGACQQQVFGYLVHIHFGKGYERPMAEERMTSRLTLRENASSSPMVKAATEQGITVVVIIGNSMPRAHERRG